MSRRRQHRKSRKKYAVVAEGETEVWYIQMIKRNNRSFPADLKPELPQKKSLADQYKLVTQLSKAYDKVFWIIDLDDINKKSLEMRKGRKTQLQQVEEYYRKLRKNEKVKIILNNPCLEFWFLLHFEATGKYYSACEGAQKQLQKYLPDYEKTRKYFTAKDNDIYLKLEKNKQTAIDNARKLKDFNFQEPHSAISEMHLLFE